MNDPAASSGVSDPEEMESQASVLCNVTQVKSLSCFLLGRFQLLHVLGAHIVGREEG